MAATSYASAFNAGGATVPVGGKIPLSMLSFSTKSVTLEDDVLKVEEDGVYAVFCSIRASAAFNISVSLMIDGGFIPNAVMVVNTGQLSQSMMVTLDLEAGQSIYLQPLNGNITLPAGANANVTLFRIGDLPE